MHLLRIIRALALLALPGKAQAVDFAVEVHPILAARCAPCHSGAKPAAGLSLASRALALSGGASGPAIVPGNSGASLLIEKVSRQRGAIMPASGEALTAANGLDNSHNRSRPGSAVGGAFAGYATAACGPSVTIK